eukprot:CAMPEP_0170550932 /NCGR_PEP_ID=MMETSP0211-20121228/8947_1 /TAXON_ID=311385 /ORGANISM="Pseudokeronopsis sp., Strain OXSARD2" /LENGTH=40 /DNA_ID= /DNA_START= /DNA_END= /DNA_ORIENTATION=
MTNPVVFTPTPEKKRYLDDYQVIEEKKEKKKDKKKKLGTN